MTSFCSMSHNSFNHNRLSADHSSVLQASDVASPTFSLVLTCYQEAQHFSKSIQSILAALARIPGPFEIIFVDDASTDGTQDLIRAFCKSHSDLSLHAVFHEQNRGRGASVREGLMIAKGPVAGFLDIDLEVSAEHIPNAVAMLEEGVAMVIADRRYESTSGIQRYLASYGYRSFTRLVLRIPQLDTEAGFKFFRMDLVRPVVKQTTDDRWFWDTEITVAIYDHGLGIRSLPVVFTRRTDKRSTVRLFRDGLRSLHALAIFAVRRAFARWYKRCKRLT